MGNYVLSLHEVDQTQVAIVGGKGAQLGELSRIEGINVPPGFCVTTDAFRRVLEEAPSIRDQIDRLSRLAQDDAESISGLSGGVRHGLEAIVVPDEIATPITNALNQFGDRVAFAVRSSATAEDLPTASFAGQHDTYLNVVGAAAILRHVSLCWASLFTERTVAYRLRNGFDHREVSMGVIVQRMVFPASAGIVFTADPVTSNRKLVTVEASFGLGETLASGRVNADVFKVRDGEVVEKAVGNKQLVIRATPAGGTHEEAIDPVQQEQPALTDAQVVRLAGLGRRIEGHFGLPQDIEWCLVDDSFQIVQSRLITTLFPIPAVDDQQNHVYLSVGHAQMMTDAMKPLGLSFWQLTTPRPMHVAGGRLFVDVAPALASSATRDSLLEVFGRSDPLVADALKTIVGRDDFIATLIDAGPGTPPNRGVPATPIETDSAIVARRIELSAVSIAKLKSDIRGKSGSALLDFILEDIQELKRILFDPKSHQVFMSAMEATWWINEHVETWLGEKNVADALAQSVPHNVSSEMGLALLDVADVIRPHAEVVRYLENVEDDGFLDEMPKLVGGQESRDAVVGYLDKYGMRCVGEIDITRSRWSERPTTLVSLILGNIRNFETGAGERRFEQGLRKAREAERGLLTRLRNLPVGEPEIDEIKRKIDLVRAFIGYREYPKFDMVSRYFVYKKALLEEAERLVQSQVLREKEDIFYLTFQELADVVRTNHSDEQLVSQRKDAFRSYQRLRPPRVFTSEGEVVHGSYQLHERPAGVLLGLPVSSGTVEGRARIILDIANADLDPGDILVTTYTDPSWSPLFVAVRGLVTEVGGLMTHGAVVAREYGLPAVVGVEQATKLITDGQRIRVHGTDGYVELLP